MLMLPDDSAESTGSRLGRPLDGGRRGGKRILGHRWAAQAYLGSWAEGEVRKIAPAATLEAAFCRAQEAWCSHTVITIRPAPLQKTFPVYLSNLFSLLPLSSYPALSLDSLLGILWFLWSLWLACGSF
jgi:hypothetical protein